MTEKDGDGVTVISHDSENKTSVDGCDPHGYYSRDTHYTGASLSQLTMTEQSPRTVSSLSNMSVMVRSSFTTTNGLDGGYHAMQLI